MDGPVLKGHKGKIGSVSLSGDASLVLSGSENKTLRLWEVRTRTGRCLRVFEGVPNDVASVGLSADDCVAVAAMEDAMRTWFLDWELDRSGSSRSRRPGWLGQLLGRE